jgi:hypothetical protein
MTLSGSHGVLLLTLLPGKALVRRIGPRLLMQKCERVAKFVDGRLDDACVRHPLATRRLTGCVEIKIQLHSRGFAPCVDANEGLGPIVTDRKVNCACVSRAYMSPSSESVSKKATAMCSRRPF